MGVSNKCCMVVDAGSAVGVYVVKHYFGWFVLVSGICME